MDRRRFLRVAGAGAAGLALAGGGAAAIGARSQRPDGPNVLVIMLDTLRPDYVGAYGSDWVRTPNIDALAAESLRFTRAFPEAMPTVPVRRSLLTGRRVYPWTDWKPTRNLPGSPGWSGFSSREVTWLKELRRAGYWTGYVSDNPFLSFAPSWGPLRDSVDLYRKIGGQVGARRPASSISLAEARRWLPRDMRTTGNYLRGMRQHLANTAGAREEREQCSARVFSHAIDDLMTAMKNKPFAFVVDCFDPHEPWVPVAKYRKMYGDPQFPLTGNVRYKPVQQYLRRREAAQLPSIYAAAVTQTDTWLGHFLDRFFESGLADETIVIFLSDHGIVLGERGWTGKPAVRLHPDLIQVPFLIRDPTGRRSGEATDYFSSPHDIGPTVLSTVGVKTPSSMDGADLSPLLRGRAPKQRRPFCYGGYANHFFYRDDRWAYIADGLNKGRQLYDIRRDPRELNSIAGDHPKVLDRIYRRVLRETRLRRLPYFGRRSA